EDIRRRHDQERDRLTFFFGNGDRCGKQFLLIMIKNLGGLKNRAAAETVLAMIKAGTHDNHVLLGCVGMGQHLAQVVEIAWVPHCDQDISRPHTHGAAAQLLIAINAELIELLGFAVALLGDMAFGDREDGKEYGAENYSRDGGLVLRK